ncbi:hypothetical protein COCC4DRAFT_125608 [Bipolaris maydis ATCC 48331]|uniref:Ketoreductase (KR) domain-containing protein n=2 Tax=Cochliobolus heterostrophus TaxID=5016 RepID=M2TSP1_COCH5|nr:uncharacterized protein COCC4DRAFT_125608 [Bipolaris maydis ATCC 48331]EMD89554.1 hypothetical protein COCHEDRAFT_12170 [Bipolaris maydis C5]KAJ5064334.1 short chain dehydrogenase/ reductase-like protein [Bipolaris maydis]ENI10233.1 hypothetical protein COCC4DRAFT_125608 [Bipolaris maydis ATCC 48331]KAJ6207401.1 short chain dehydrogenase/ reductase-like protein [Bipolaris maydis]KAJ6269935.1 hypothetical protein PSV08DRAFT_182142 [Bipolaris maydis]
MTSHTHFGRDTKASEVADAFSAQIKDLVVTEISGLMLGGAIALVFAKHEPEMLIPASRAQSKMDEFAANIKAVDADVDVRNVLEDLLSQTAVRQAAEEIKSHTARIDILVNNAATNMYERKHTSENIEYQLAVNHIRPFLLTNLLMDFFLEAAMFSPPGATRVINMTSDGHRASPFKFHDYNYEGKPVSPEEADSLAEWPPETQKANGGHIGFLAYGQSKTANTLFSVDLNKLLAHGSIVSYIVHPGNIIIELGRHMHEDPAKKLPDIMSATYLDPSVEEGASTTMVAALDPILTSAEGLFLEDCQLIFAKPYVVDSVNAERLWVLSKKLVARKFL